MGENAPSSMVATALVRRAGLEPRHNLEQMALDYLARAKRARRVGVWAAVGLVTIGLSISSKSDSGALTVAQLCFGYLLGSVVAGWALERQLGRSTVRSASLQRRTTSSLLPSWARVLPWVTLLPCVASPLLLLGHRPEGTPHETNAVATTPLMWFEPTTLIAISGAAAVALLLTCSLEWRLTRRKVDSDDPDAVHLHLVTRALSARATAGAACALGFALLSGLGYLSNDARLSYRCGPAAICHDSYQEAALRNFYDISFPLLVIAVVLLAVSGLMVPPRSLGTGTQVAP